MLRFDCPHCRYHADDNEARCPECHSVFPADDLEELWRLGYLSLRLIEWRKKGLLPLATAERMFEEIRREREAVEARLGLVPVGGTARAVAALEWDVPGSERIRISVRDGRVLLEGTVDWQYQKRAAELVVHRLTGVKTVLNFVEVDHPEKVARFIPGMGAVDNYIGTVP